jgi:hypothetical protein
MFEGNGMGNYCALSPMREVRKEPKAVTCANTTMATCSFNYNIARLHAARKKSVLLMIVTGEGCVQ